MREDERATMELYILSRNYVAEDVWAELSVEEQDELIIAITKMEDDRWDDEQKMRLVEPTEEQWHEELVDG